MEYEKIGKFIAECRKEKAMTQKELAIKIGVTDKAVSKWERGLGCPDVSLLGELANELDIGIGELLNGERNESLKDNNKFILKAVDYTRKNITNNIYKKMTYVIMIAITLLGISLIFFNIDKTKYLTDTIVYDFNNTKILELKSDIKTLKERLDIFKNIKQDQVENLDDDKYDYVFVKYPQYFIENLENNQLVKYDKKMKLKKIYVLNEIEKINYNYYLTNATSTILNQNNLISTDELYKDLDVFLLNYYEGVYEDENGNIYNFNIYMEPKNLDTNDIDQYIDKISFTVKYYNKIVDDLLKELNIDE